MKIKVKITCPNCKFEIRKNGDLIDLKAAEDIALEAPQAKMKKKVIVNGVIKSYKDVVFDTKTISLGIAMQLPKGFKANVLPRSSTFKNYGVMLVNSEGMIDTSYCGNEDIWKFQVIAFKHSFIHKGDRIAQFEIVPSMFATTWQKLKWIFNGYPKFEFVDNLGNNNRGGIGSTGIK